MKQVLDRNAGRDLFGSSAADYDRYRPSYPPDLYAELRSHCGLAPGIAVLEIGPGTGQATRDLLVDGPAEYLAIEPDGRMADLLRRRHAGPGFSVRTVAFERARLPRAHFDLGVAAMSFHWVDPDAGLAKVAATVRPDGAFAMWWTRFGDSDHPDAFQRAARPILTGTANAPAAFGSGTLHRADDRGERLAALDRHFGATHYAEFPWTLTLSASALRGLFATFSPILALPPERREKTLDALEELARTEFNSRVARPVTTRLYCGIHPRKK